MSLKFGAKPFIPPLGSKWFGKYRTGAPLPPHPATFGHEDLIRDWMMLANDRAGDCVFAGGAHETMLFCAIGGRTTEFNDDVVLGDYSAVTGYDPNNPDSDTGTDPSQAAEYRKNIGLLDAQGTRHKIGAYVFADPNSYDQFLEAIWLFGAVGLATAVPQSAMNQFYAGEDWHVVPSSDWEGRQIVGYHYIPAVASRGTPKIVTWGKVIGMTNDFFRRYVQNVIVYLSEEVLNGGRNLEGFDLETLKRDLQQFN